MHYLRALNWNISAASRATGVSRKHLRTLIHKHEIDIKKAQNDGTFEGAFEVVDAAG